jgi:putative pyridoxal-dependent aspartate 1-decarboxylase
MQCADLAINRIKRLFDRDESAMSDIRALDESVNRAVERLGQSSQIHSGVCITELTEGYRGSEMPCRELDPCEYVDHVRASIVEHCVNTSSPRFIGHMTSALPYFVGPLAKLIAELNQNMVKLETAKCLSLCERQVLAIFHRILFDFPDEFYSQHIQRPESTLGMIVSGGTIANTTALWCARNAALGPGEGFAGVESQGMEAALRHYGYRRAVVIGGASMHYSIKKAAELLGIGSQNVLTVQLDSDRRVAVHALMQVVRQCQTNGDLILTVIGIAGATDCGAVDPLQRLAEIAHSAGAHFHVDAAWGGALIFSNEHRHKLAGIEQADSVTIDAHKQLYIPMGAGMILLRDPALARKIEKQAQYILRPNSIDLGKRALEGSRPSMSLFLHAGLHIIGARGYEFLVDQGIRNAYFMADEISGRVEFELLNKPTMNIVLYRYLPERCRARARKRELRGSDVRFINLVNQRLQRQQRNEGFNFVSRTAVERDGEGQIVALRAVLANPKTTPRDIRAVLDDQVRLAEALLQKTRVIAMRATS